MQILSVSIVVISAFVLSGCVSESTYVGSDRPVQQRQVNNTEAARTRMSLGLNYLQRGENAQAIYNLERARVMAPQLPEVYNALAYYYQSVGENQQAEAAYQQALAREDNNADTYNNYGAFLCQIEKYDEAERLLLAAIRRPGYMRVSESYENLAMCQLVQNNFGRAHHYFEASVLHSSNRISSLLNLSALEYAMGNHQTARAHLTRIQRLGHVSANTSLLSYLIAAKELNQEIMESSRELLLQVYPDSEPARLMLQRKLDQTEYEQLRERYKKHLIAQIELPAGAEHEKAAAALSPQPQIRIVRKTAPTTTNSMRRSESLAHPAVHLSSELNLPEQNPPEHSSASADELLKTPIPSELAHEASDSAASLAYRSSLTPARGRPDTHTASKESVELASRYDASPSLAVKLPELPSPQLNISKQVTGHSVSGQATLIELPTGVVVNQSDDFVDHAASRSEYTDATEYTETVSASAVDEVQPGHALIALDAQYNADTVLLDNEDAQDNSSTALLENVVAQHIVQQGESLFSISVQHNIRLDRLQQWNNLTPEAVIRSDQRLWLAEAPEEWQNQPAPSVNERPNVHVVVNGDTLFSISMLYNVRLSRLLHWNNLTEQSRVYIGQHVLLNDPADVNYDD